MKTRTFTSVCTLCDAVVLAPAALTRRDSPVVLFAQLMESYKSLRQFVSSLVLVKRCSGLPHFMRLWGWPWHDSFLLSPANCTCSGIVLHEGMLGPGPPMRTSYQDPFIAGRGELLSMNKCSARWPSHKSFVSAPVHYKNSGAFALRIGASSRIVYLAKCEEASLFCLGEGMVGPRHFHAIFWSNSGHRQIVD